MEGCVMPVFGLSKFIVLKRSPTSALLGHCPPLPQKMSTAQAINVFKMHYLFLLYGSFFLKSIQKCL